MAHGKGGIGEGKNGRSKQAKEKMEVKGREIKGREGSQDHTRQATHPSDGRPQTIIVHYLSLQPFVFNAHSVFCSYL